MTAEVKNFCVTVVQRKDRLCSVGVHEYCTQSRNPPIVQCLSCGHVVTDFSSFTEEDFDNLDKIDNRLREEKLDLYK